MGHRCRVLRRVRLEMGSGRVRTGFDSAVRVPVLLGAGALTDTGCSRRRIGSAPTLPPAKRRWIIEVERRGIEVLYAGIAPGETPGDPRSEATAMSSAPRPTLPPMKRRWMIVALLMSLWPHRAFIARAGRARAERACAGRGRFYPRTRIGASGDFRLWVSYRRAGQ